MPTKLTLVPSPYCRERLIQVQGSLEGDPLVLHCAFLLRTIFATLARAHKRVRVQNVEISLKLSSIAR